MEFFLLYKMRPQRVKSNLRVRDDQFGFGSKSNCPRIVNNIEPHEAVPEVSRSKVHITQNKHVPIEWFVTTASQSRI